MRRCKHLPSHHYCVFLRLGHSCLHVSSAQWSSWREGPCDALGVPSDPCLPRTRAPHTRPPGIRSQHPDGRGRFPGAPRLATRRALRPVGDAQATGRMRDAGAERSGRGRRGPCALAAAILWPLLLLLRVTSTSSLSAGERAGWPGRSEERRSPASRGPALPPAADTRPEGPARQVWFPGPGRKAPWKERRGWGSRAGPAGLDLRPLQSSAPHTLISRMGKCYCRRDCGRSVSGSLQSGGALGGEGRAQSLRGRVVERCIPSAASAPTHTA